MKISAMAKQYLTWFGARGSSPKTREGYDLTYRQYVAYLESHGRADDLRHFTPETIDAFATAGATAGQKAGTVNNSLSRLHSLGEFGKKTKCPMGDYYLVENPLDRVVRVKRQRPVRKYLYVAELKQLLAFEGTAAERLALAVLVDTVLRVSEVCNANAEDLTFDGGRALLAVVVKGGRSRTITLDTEIAQRILTNLVRREARPASPLIVSEQGHRYTRTALSEMVRRLAVKAGITRLPVRAHVLRHSIATLAIAAGVDIPAVAALLNHSDISTVQRYVHREDAVDAARATVREALH